MSTESAKATWPLIQLVLVVVGGSLLAFTKLVGHHPTAGAWVVLAGLVVLLSEGAFRVDRSVHVSLQDAQAKLVRYQAGSPCLSFGRAEMSRQPHPIVVTLPGHGEPVLRRGWIIRVPVMNAPGARSAQHVHARLQFGDSDSQFFPRPTQGEWASEAGSEVEIDLAGNGRPRLLEVVAVIIGEYPHAYEWTKQSRDVGLSGYGIKARPFEVTIDVMGSGDGSNVPTVSGVLRIDVRDGHMVRADWVRGGPNDVTNWVPWP